MSYPPPNPYDPNQQPQPGYGQPSPQPPQHYSTDADPYSRPDPYGQSPYGNPPMSVQPGSVPPGGMAQPPGQTPPGPMPPGHVPPPANPFQPGQPAPPPPGGSSNTPLLVTLIVVVVAVAAGAIIIGMMFTGDDGETDVAGNETTAAEASSAAEETTEAEETSEPSPAETTEAEGADYRLPEIDECIENVDEGFYVVPCDSDTAYWKVLHIEKNPDDPDPDDEWHYTAAHNACKDFDYTNYYFTDTAVSAGRDWDPEIDSITAIYCVREVG
ncbi:hypothetical protein GCM10027447_22430 [Glycomyces halotolerans]